MYRSVAHGCVDMREFVSELAVCHPQNTHTTNKASIWNVPIHTFVHSGALKGPHIRGRALYEYFIIKINWNVFDKRSVAMNSPQFDVKQDDTVHPAKATVLWEGFDPPGPSFPISLYLSQLVCGHFQEFLSKRPFLVFVLLRTQVYWYAFLFSCLSSKPTNRNFIPVPHNLLIVTASYQIERDGRHQVALPPFNHSTSSKLNWTHSQLRQQTKATHNCCFLSCLPDTDHQTSNDPWPFFCGGHNSKNTIAR